MKKTHLVAAMLASLSMAGGAQSIVQSAPIVAAQSQKQYAIKQADTAVKIHFDRMMSTPVIGIENHPCSWRKLNQRQIRKNRRRAHAAGKSNAFA
jgi:hypothetical protein